MAANYFEIHPENPQERLIDQAVEVLKDGGVIIYPTDTIYGIGCSIYDVKAIERICLIKNIKQKQANFSFICSDISHISEFVKPMDNVIFKTMKRALPGPYTFILNANNKVPKILQAKKKTVGIRIPSHNVPLRLVEKLGNPIITTSIHDSDKIVEYTTDPTIIYDNYQNLVDLVIDSGYGSNEPSTVIDCTGAEMVVLREGKGTSDLLI